MKKILPLLVLGAIIFSAGCIGETSVIGNENDAPEEATVEITSDGFQPETVTIQKGGKVTWVNKMNDQVWIASDNHPTHTIYPEVDYEGSYQGSQGCTSKGQPVKGAFDSCEGIVQGETFIFTFEHSGEWGYHNHFSPGMTGTVKVVE